MNTSSTFGGVKQTDTSESWDDPISLSIVQIILVKRAHVFCVGEELRTHRDLSSP